MFLNTESILACPGLFWTSDPLWTTQNLKREKMMNVKDVWLEMMNQFLEEYLIYFKSELMLNSKLSHLSNSLIRSHSAITRKCSGLSEMAICVKVFCFRPNWALHNKIMVAGFIYNIFQKHQYCQILNFSKVKPTPPSIMLQHIH